MSHIHTGICTLTQGQTREDPHARTRRYRTFFPPMQRSSFAVSPKPQTHRLDKQTEMDCENRLIDGPFVQLFITNNRSCDNPKVYLGK